MKESQKNKNDAPVILVTGAGEGIGEATAKLFAEKGYRVACLGRTEKNTKATADAIEADGHEAMTVLADISNFEEMKKAVSQIKEKWNRLDAVLANAGINGVWAPIDELSAEDFEKTIKINLNGTFHTIKAAIDLLKAKGGAVVITASVNGNRIFTNSGATAYSSSKAGQVAMMKMLALELAKHKIRVNSIAPGSIETNIGDNTEYIDQDKAREPVVFPEGEIPLTDGKPGSAKDCAELVYFLCSQESRHITGTNVYIDGAQSLLQG